MCYQCEDLPFEERIRQAQLIQQEEYERDKLAREKTESREIKNLSESDKAKRFDKDKLFYADLPLSGLTEVAKVTTFGAQKYGRFNWQKGFPISNLIDATMRHLIGDSNHKGAFTGELIDKESNVLHIAHAVWNLLAILHQLNDKEKYKDFIDLETYK